MDTTPTATQELTDDSNLNHCGGIVNVLGLLETSRHRSVSIYFKGSPT